MQILQGQFAVGPCRRCSDNTDADAASCMHQGHRDGDTLAGSGEEQHMGLAIPLAVHQDGAHRPGRG